jgi:MYXO-CTERM domain-containing protein
MRTLVTALNVALVLSLATPALLDAQQSQQSPQVQQDRPGTATTESPRTTDRDMEWGWLGLLGLAGLLGLRRREVHHDTAATPRRATGTYGG